MQSLNSQSEMLLAATIMAVATGKSKEEQVARDVAEM